MTTQTDFTPEEWKQLIYAPLIAGSLIIGSDISVTGFVKEAKAMKEATLNYEAADQSLVADLVADFVKRMEAKEKFEAPKFSNEEEISAALKQISDAAATLEAKATPEDAKSFGQWVMNVAQATAEAAKEGGMFSKKVLVSDKEKAMLERIQQALGQNNA
jgi:hypothetical protein